MFDLESGLRFMFAWIAFWSLVAGAAIVGGLWYFFG